MLNKCVTCGKEVKKPYAYTFRYDKEKSEWVEDGGVVCGEVCGQLWAKDGSEQDFWVP